MTANREIAPRELTEKQAAFVAAYTGTPGAIGDYTEAARRAGYSEQSAAKIGHQLLTLPWIQSAIHEANRRQLGDDLASKAIEVLRQILRDEKAPLKIKLEAAKTILDRAGYVAARTPDDDKSRRKAPEEMSVAELEAFVREGEAALAVRNAAMKVVSPTLEHDDCEGDDTTTDKHP